MCGKAVDGSYLSPLKYVPFSLATPRMSLIIDNESLDPFITWHNRYKQRKACK